MSLRSFIEDGGARLKQLLSRLHAGGMTTFRFPKVHPAEISKEFWRRSVSAPPAGIDSTQRRRGPSRSVLKNFGDKGEGTSRSRRSSTCRCRSGLVRPERRTSTH